MNKTNRKIRGMYVGIVFLALAAPASADMMCFPGNLSGLIGTTCNVGNLKFRFNDFSSVNSAGVPWSPSDFTLTPVTNGFTLSFDGGPQSITAPINGQVADNTSLDYTVSVTDPLNEHIAGMGVIAGNVLVSGSTHSWAYSIGSTDNIQGTFALVVVGNGFIQVVGTVHHDVNSTFENAPPPRVPGLFIRDPYRFSDDSTMVLGTLLPFGLHAENGDSASWDGAPISLNYALAPGSVVPDSSSCLLLLSIVLMSLGGLAFLSHRRSAAYAGRISSS